MKVLISELK